MQWTPKLRALFENYVQLLIERKHRPLGPEEDSQLQLLRDVVLEAGVTLESEVSHFARRSPRAALHLEVAFATASAAAKAITRELGTGGLALTTELELAVGTLVSLEVQVPGYAQPVRSLAEVVWTKAGAVGFAFHDLAEADASLLKQLVAEHSSILDRVRRALATPTATVAQVSVAPNVLLRIGDALLNEAASAILTIRGLHVATELGEMQKPMVLVSDLPNLADLIAVHPELPLVLVNASGPDALVRGLSQVRPRAYVKRPASPQAIADSVQAVINGLNAAGRR